MAYPNDLASNSYWKYYGIVDVMNATREEETDERKKLHT